MKTIKLNLYYIQYNIMEYQALLEKVQFIVQNIGCHIEMNQIDSAYMFTIYDNFLYNNI